MALETVIYHAIKVVALFSALLGVTAYVTLAERKFSAFIQDRIGPNRAGPKGLLQPIADGIKNLFKEHFIPANADKFCYIAAPLVICFPAFTTYTVVPFAKPFEMFGREISLQVADINMGVLFLFALLGMSVYGLILAGWSSNNKYSLLGGLRASAQVISYELTLGLSLVGILMISESLTVSSIVESQEGWLIWDWNCFKQPLGCILFIIAVFAETNRLPFDLTEAEQELVGGFHTEYQGMRFALFMLAEYTNVVTTSAILTTFFFGGYYWGIPALDQVEGILGALISLAAFAAKTGFFIFLFIWVRWTLPRFRFDQLMAIGWKVFLPLAILNVIITATWQLIF